MVYRIEKWMLTLSLLALALLAMGGCRLGWETIVVAPDGSEFPVDRARLQDLEVFDEGSGVPVDRLLWQAGHTVIERVVVTDSGGERHEFDWPAVADDAWWRQDGKVVINGQEIAAMRIEATPSPRLAGLEARITDLAATAASAVELPAPAESVGRVLDPRQAPQVLLLFLDGFGYIRYEEAQSAGLIPNLAALGEPMLALTAYVPSTKVGSAALLTGAPPEVNGVDGRSIRKTEVETLFDVATAAGLKVVSVEGEALSFNLRNTEVQLSGDRDGDGRTDDNVLANALAVLDEGMPDLFYVHFHGIDDAGHTYGPGAPEEEATIQYVDGAVGQLLEALPAETLVLIFADHGMHLVQGQERVGNHGHLIERDMLIPIWITQMTD